MRSKLLWIFMGLILILLAAPLVVVFGVSLNEPKQLVFPPQGLSLAWYVEVFRDAHWRRALINSVTVALLSSSVALVFALPLALYVWSRGNRFGKILLALGVTPFMIPPVISALGFLFFWLLSGGYGKYFTTVISHGVFFFTLPLMTISLGLAAVEAQYLEAARLMGATRFQLLRTIILPLIRPHIFSGFAFAMVLSLNEYIIAYMVAGYTVETLPIKIFNAMRYGYTPVMAAVAVIFVVSAMVIFGLVARFGDLPELLGAKKQGRADG